MSRPRTGPVRPPEDGAPDASAGGEDDDVSDEVPDVEHNARVAERLQGHTRSFDDANGTNPTRSQQARRPTGSDPPDQR
jgi:hypothetical protein